jgi:hypothetical protein
MTVHSPPSPVITNFMEDFEKAALDSAPNNPSAGSASWMTPSSSGHGPDKLKDFLNQLNIFRLCIHFTMDTESVGHLPFLDIDTYRRPDGSLDHCV